MAISTLEENKAGHEELGELEGKGSNLGQGAQGRPPSQWGIWAEIGKRVRQSSHHDRRPVQPLYSPAGSFTLKLSSKYTGILAAASFTSVFPGSPCLSFYSWHCPAYQGLQPSSPSPSSCPSPHIHIPPNKPSHLASHHLLSLEYLAIFPGQTYLPQTSSIKKTKPTS